MQEKLRNLAITKFRASCDIGFMTDEAFTKRQTAFAQWIDLNGLTFRRIESVTGVPYSSLKSFATKAGAGMNDRNRTKILQGFRCRDEDVFVSPKQIDLSQAGQQPDYPAEQSELPTSKLADGMISIPAYDIKLAAGGGYYVDVPEVGVPWVLPKSFITGSLGLNPETLSVVEVVGISMTPTLQPRDRVLIDHSDTNPSPPGIFAIWDGSGLLIKNVSRLNPRKPEQIIITSDNPSYPPLETTLEEITIIGRVKWFGRGM